jgi:L-ribulose-5-phosphate 3-epimerase
MIAKNCQQPFPPGGIFFLMDNSPNRRDVLKMGTGALAMAAIAAGASTDTAGAAHAGKRALKKAVMWGMIDGKGSVLEKFQILKDAGFDGVEMDSPGGPPNDEIKEAMKQTGIEVEGIVDSVHWRETLSHQDPAMRAKGLEALKIALHDCKELGGTSVLLVPGKVDASVSYADCYSRSQEQIRKAIPLARELGVKIAVENVWNNFLLSPLEAAKYIDEFEASDAIGWHFDIGNILYYGWPEQWIRILGHRILKLHIKEYSMTKLDKEGRWAGFKVELLEGSNDWPAIMQAIDEIGYNTWACAELAGGDLARLKVVAGQMDKILAQ